MKRFKFTRLKSRLMFWLLLVSLLPLFIVGTVMVLQQYYSLKMQAFGTLQSIRDFKANQFHSWLDEKTGDITIFARDMQIHDIARISGDTPNTPQAREALAQAYQFCDSVLNNYADYKELFIVDPRSEKVVFSTDKTSIGSDKSDSPYIIEAIRTKHLYISDIYISKKYRSPTMVLSIPIRKPDAKQGDISGIFAARIDLEHSVFNMLLDRTGLGTSGEALIVDRDATALNELRWYNNASLKLKIEAEPAKLAAGGKTGIVESTDYRGVKVLAAYTFIPEAQWGLVVKIDQDEIYAPIHRMLWNILMLMILSSGAVYVIAVFLSGNIARPVLEMADVATQLQAGDLSVRNTLRTEDEINYLARAFNRMADSLESRFRIETLVARTKEIMVGVSDLKGFRDVILNELIDVTGSDFGAYYLLNPDTRQFEHFTSVGLNPQMMEPFDSLIKEGQIGTVLQSRRVSHLQNISENSVFTYKTFIGNLVPREMITIPVVIDEVVRAVICLGKVVPYSPEILQVLDQVWLTLNMTFSSLVSIDEIKQMAEELNSKNQVLEAQSHELQAQTEELFQQSEELQRQNRELEYQREQVEEMNRMKSRFLSNMSHELRTPLNSVMALSRILIMQAKSKLTEEEGGYLDIIERNGKNLLMLINSILDLSKIEAGRVDIHPRLFDIRTSVNGILESLEPIAREKHLSVRSDFQDQFPSIENDEDKVHQILQNIIGNAVKFTEEGGVTISARYDDESVRLDISDTGIGISEHELPHVFEEFRQVDGSTSRKYEGTGLGLAIAYKYTKMLGGDLSAESAPGQGSTFTLILPIRWRGEQTIVESAVKPPPVEIRPERRTVLVVDDQPEVLRMISSFLRKEGYNTITATSGTEALKMAEQFRPFAITLDIVMPDMDGWEVLQNLKSKAATRDIPVVIVSVADDKETGSALGAVGYVTKPVDEKALLSEIYKIGKPRPVKVMVVDDNAIIRKQIADILVKDGIQVLEAADGAQCLTRLEQQIPDILVLDLIMPEMDGFQVLDYLRSLPETRELPVIIVTAKDLTREDIQKLRGNITSILTKTATSSDNLLNEIRRILKDIDKVSHPVPGAGVPGAARKILVVEDNETAILQLKMVLEKEGYAVDVARGGRAAIDYVRGTVPSGIILDLMMPEVDGFQVLDTIRAGRHTEDVPVLVLTAKDLSEDDLQKLRSGHIEYLVQKGDIDREGLLNKIRRMMERGPAPPEKTSGFTAVRPDQGPETSPTGPGKKRRGTLRAGDRKATVLVVEDNPDNMTSIKAVLKNRFHILEATDGDQGLQVAKQFRPDLVLLDMSLPEMDGLTVVGEIRKDVDLEQIPVIALTAQAMKGDRETMIDAGCDDYISKPFDPQALLETVLYWTGFNELR